MKYALALGGGGARGAFEAGVWNALREMNKEIQAIAGTSVGAVNGAAFAAGVETDALWNNIKARNIVPGIKNDNILSADSILNSALDILKGGIDILPLKNLISSLISEEAVRNSQTDFGICAYSSTDKSVKEVFADRIPNGKLIDYILASACFPIFKDVVIDNKKFIDGGAFNNLPADMLIRRGYKNIISVSAGGPGIERDFCGRGVNIIKIKYENPEQGVMEFCNDAAKRSIRLGELECKKVFGKYRGEYFFINADSYNNAAFHYGTNIITDIEEAGKIIGLNRLRAYSFSELAKAVLLRYEDNERLRKEVKMLDKKTDQLIDKLHGTLSCAANAVLYMKINKN